MSPRKSCCKGRESLLALLFAWQQQYHHNVAMMCELAILFQKQRVMHMRLLHQGVPDAILQGGRCTSIPADDASSDHSGNVLFDTAVSSALARVDDATSAWCAKPWDIPRCAGTQLVLSDVVGSGRSRAGRISVEGPRQSLQLAHTRSYPGDVCFQHLPDVRSGTSVHCLQRTPHMKPLKLHPLSLNVLQEDAELRFDLFGGVASTPASGFAQTGPGDGSAIPAILMQPGVSSYATPQNTPSAFLSMFSTACKARLTIHPAIAADPKWTPQAVSTISRLHVRSGLPACFAVVAFTFKSAHLAPTIASTRQPSGCRLDAKDPQTHKRQRCQARSAAQAAQARNGQDVPEVVAEPHAQPGLRPSRPPPRWRRGPKQLLQ